MSKTLFFAYDETRGTTYHFVDWIIALERNNTQNDIKYLISKKEQNEGLLEKLKKNIENFDQKIYFIENLNSKVFDDIDVVHVHGLQQLKLLQKNNNKAKVVFTVHAYRNSKWYKNIFKILFAYYLRDVKKIQFLSNLALEDFYKYNPFKYILKKKSTVAFLGVNHDEYGNPNLYKEFSEKYNINFDNSKKNIVYLAQFHKAKGHEWLIRSIPMITNKDFVLWLFGDGPLRSEMIKLTKTLNLTERVKIPGLVERKYVPSIFNKSYCAISVSKSENGAHNLIEPFASSKPLIGTTAGPGNDFLQDYYTGFRVEWKNKDQLAKSIEYALDNRDAVSSMGENAKRLSEIFFTWDAMSKNCFFVYGEIINENNH